MAHRWSKVVAAPVGAALLAAALVPFVVELPPAPDTVPPMELAGAESRFAVVDGIRFRYMQAGEGEEPALVLLHGSGANAASWRPVIDGLARERRVVAFDRPGFGLTARPMPPLPAGDPYAPGSAAEQTVALMDYLGVGKAVLVAHSAAAGVAVRAALDNPQRIEGLVLEAPAFDGGGTLAARLLRPLMRTRWGRFYGPLAIRRTFPPAAQRVLERSHHDARRTLTAELVSAYRLPLRAQDWDRALWELSAAGPDGAAPALQELRVPVSVVYGSEDAIVAPQESARVAAAIRGADAAELAGTGHVPHEERPAEFASAVERLLERARTKR
ncbi:MAG: alpha/beta fold hydrolase [Coriobacteriia bacterium]|nr:alpha/beta fold hydrolase [Coriobacteriia bacterium]